MSDSALQHSLLGLAQLSAEEVVVAQPSRWRLVYIRYRSKRICLVDEVTVVICTALLSRVTSRLVSTNRLGDNLKQIRVESSKSSLSVTKRRRARVRELEQGKVETQIS